MAKPFDPQTLRMLQLVTRGLDYSPGYRAARGMTTMQRLAQMQDSPMLKLARGESVMQRFTEIEQSPVMRAVRGDATWNMLTRGEPAVLAALRQPTLAQRLNQVVADADAARMDQALLLARATYEDVLYGAAGEGLESPAQVGDEYESLLDDAEQHVAAALQELDVDGRAAVDQAVDAARSDLSAALSSASPPPEGVVMVSVAEQQETNRLLRELLAKKPEPDQVVRWATLVLVVIGILALIVALNPPAATAPQTRPAPITQTVRPEPPAPTEPSVSPPMSRLHRAATTRAITGAMVAGRRRRSGGGQPGKP